MRFLLSIICSSVLCGFVSAQQAATELHIHEGRVRGAVSEGVISFKGIPFAQPPTGENRWRPPQPVQSWTGVRDATEYAADCMQLPFPSDAAPLGTKPSEDCLYLNVWTPAGQANKNLPVMVWIYGGGFVNGGSSPAVYSGAHFAKQGLVFVSFNYRLGRFGFFGHPASTAESKDGLLGNYGYMDQIAALKWVQRNIKAFGGDPKNVTLFGESAGGGSVLAMMTSPLSKGLFQKAIIESGGGRGLFPTRYLSKSLPNRPSAEQIGIESAKKAGISSEGKDALTALRALSADQVVDGLNMASMNSPTYAGPMIDGKLLVEEPEAAFLGGRQAKIPLIAGANSSDIGFSPAKSREELFGPFGPDRSSAEKAYDENAKAEFDALRSAMAADRMMVEPARFVVQTQRTAGQPAFEYRFSYVAESMRKQWKGAPHATEIPFVFDTVNEKYGSALTTADEDMARAVNAYWAAFVKAGTPSAASLPEWPTYDPNADLLMNFTESGPKVEKDPWHDRMEVMRRAAEARKRD